MPYENGSAGRIAYDKQIDDIQRHVADLTRAAYKAMRLMEEHKDDYHPEQIETTSARWQALEDCLDALSGASKR